MIFIPTNQINKALKRAKIAEAILTPNSLNPKTSIHMAIHQIAKGGLELYKSGCPKR